MIVDYDTDQDWLWLMNYLFSLPKPIKEEILSSIQTCPAVYKALAPINPFSVNLMLSYLLDLYTPHKSHTKISDVYIQSVGRELTETDREINREIRAMQLSVEQGSIPRKVKSRGYGKKKSNLAKPIEG